MKNVALVLILCWFCSCQIACAQMKNGHNNAKEPQTKAELYFEAYDLTAFFADNEIKVKAGSKAHLDKEYTVKDFWSISRSHKSEYRLILDDVELNWADSNGWVEKENNYASNTIRIHKPELLNESVLSFERVSDELVIVNEFKSDSMDLFATPVKSLIYINEDSIIVDSETGYGVAVYPPPIPGFERSGVYNYKMRDWLIEPKYRKSQLTSNGFLLTEYLRDSIGGFWVDILYGFIDSNGGVIHSQTPIKSAINDEGWLSLISDRDNAVSVKKHLSLDRNYNKNPELFAVDTFDSQQVYSKIHNGHYFENIQLTKPATFAHYNPDFDFIYWVNNDSIYLDWSNQVFVTDLSNGKIELKINYKKNSIHAYRSEPMNPSIVNVEIKVYKRNDTLISIKQLDEEDEEIISIYSSLSFETGKLVLNDYSVIEFDLTVWNEYGSMGDKINHHYESENSSIWTKKGSIWTKSTTNYATIEPVPFGFLVSTPKIYQEAHDQQEAINQPKRYLLLDTNLRAISFMDFFDFEEAEVYTFGVSLKTETGRFLVNNHGKAVTNAEWDDFKMEAGKVVAIRYMPRTRLIKDQAVIDLKLR